MDRKQLSQYRYLEREISDFNIRLCSESLSEKERNLLEQRRAESVRLFNSISEYINAIPDTITRQIFINRYVLGMTWGSVACKLGGGVTSDCVKKIAYRYNKKHSDNIS